MKILIATIGSRGDVQPFLALALGLQAAGHEVWLSTDATFEPMIRQAKIGFSPVNANPQQALQEDIRKIGGNPIKLFRWINRLFKPLAMAYFRDTLTACQGKDAVIFSSLAFAAYHIADHLGLPSLPTYLQPVTPSRAFPGTGSFIAPDWMPFQGAFNWYGTRLGNLSFMRMIKSTVDECRRVVLNKPPIPWATYASLDISDQPILYGFSQHVIPKPADWGDWLHISGYWFLEGDRAWQPPAGLVDFLEAEPPPIYVGFGSMVDREADALTRLVVEALNLARVRAILLGGWSDLGVAGLPESVFRVQNVPHSWLFPRVSAVVHHGGAGTTAAGIRAGVPTVTVPFFADQPFWGRQVHKIGVGTKPIPRNKLTAGRLAEAITQAVEDEEMAGRAAELGEKIRAEDGIRNGVAMIEGYFGV